MLDTLTGTLEQGLLFSLMVLGVYITFRVLDYADLTVDGSFTMGGAIAAGLIYAGHNPWLSTIIAFFGGLAAGTVTGVLHTNLRITPLLSGILTMTGLYSINLRIMGRANTPLLRTETVITGFNSYFGLDPKYGTIVLAALVVLIVTLALHFFLRTEIGLALRATGDNEQMIRAQGVNTDHMKILGLSLSNGMVALSGALVAQNQQFADAGMGIGMIIAGLASVIIGEALIGTSSLFRVLIAVIGGSIIYRLVIALVLRLGFAPTDLKLLTAIIVVIALASPQIKARFFNRKHRQKEVSLDAARSTASKDL